MPFCANCGAPVEGRFCAKCGSAVASGGPTAGGAIPVATPMAENVASALCYVLGLITGIVFLVIAPYNQNRNIRFHAFQSIFLNIAVIVLEIALSIVAGIMTRIIGFWLFGLIWPLFGLACVGLWIYMILSAYQGKTVVLPVVGPLAQQQA
jgi:uncharacterized membrane protein